ncbi:MAG TPA: sigma-70 family RNA polymerase sigma factor [Gemmataceae bacterium]
MSDGPVNSATRQPSYADVAPPPEGGTDRELLARFAADREESAFATLVERHGPMVLDVCRRVLHDAHEAEDACQATFLVLARKSGSLRQPELLANWLYGVAYRSARKAQRQKVRYCAHAMRGASMQATDATADLIWKDLRPVLDEELDRLPAKFRAPVVLCYLEGLKAEEAARRLGCPRGTILSRLARARQRLSSRLAKRGLALSTGFLGLLLTRKAAASASLPSEFVKSTVTAARLFATPKPSISGRAGGRANNIAQGVLMAMFLAKLQFVSMCLLVGGVVVIGTTTAARIALAAGAGKTAVALGANEERVLGADQASKQDKNRLQGAWREVELENANGKADPEAIKQIRWIVKDDGFRMIAEQNGQEQLFEAKFQFRLDASTKPKKIDISVNGEPYWIGIYELTDESFKMCTTDKGRPRPTNFVPQGDQIVWGLKREAGANGANPAKKP